MTPARRRPSLRSRDAHCGDRRSGRHGQGHDGRRGSERGRRARAPGRPRRGARGRGRGRARERRGAGAGRERGGHARRAGRRRRGRQRRLAPAQPARSCRPASRSARTTPISAASTTSRSSSTSSTRPSARPGSRPRSRWARRRASRTCSRRRPSPSSRRSSRSRCSTPSSPGGPYDPDEPYVPAYAADTLIDEFTRPAPMFIDGREQLMPAAGGARTYHLPEGDVECVYTIHSEQATLPRSYADRGIRTVEWRLGLPPAHTLPLRALVAAGMASTDPVLVDGREVRPRDVLVAVLARQGGAPDDPGRARAPARPRRRHERRRARRDRRRPPARPARRVGHRLRHVLDRRAALDRGAAARERPGAAHRRRRPRGDHPGRAPSSPRSRRRGMHAEISVRRPLG